MPLDIDWKNKWILVTPPDDTVDIQDLVNFVREQEASETGIAYDQIIEAQGKFDLGGGVYTGIAVRLLSPWRIKFWAGVGTGYITGGTLTGGLDNQPIEPTGGSDTIIVQNQVGSTLVIAEGTTTTEVSKVAVTETLYKWGDEIKVRFVSKENSSVVIYVYDPNNNTIVDGESMTEVIDGVYEYSFTPDSSWGEGIFMVYCVNLSNNTDDVMSIRIVSPNNYFATKQQLRQHDQKMTALNMIR